jgi:hypothetical protein
VDAFTVAVMVAAEAELPPAGRASSAIHIDNLDATECSKVVPFAHAAIEQ